MSYASVSYGDPFLRELIVDFEIMYFRGLCLIGTNQVRCALMPFSVDLPIPILADIHIISSFKGKECTSA